MPDTTGKPKRRLKTLAVGCIVLAAILSTVGYKWYRKQLLLIGLFEALEEISPPYAYNREGLRIPGHKVKDGFVFVPQLGDAGSWGGLGTWYEYEPGKVTTLKGMPKPVYDRWFEGLSPDKQKDIFDGRIRELPER
jgi:hypothetical protein